jgi:serine/threonine-protein kinase RsbW
MSPRKGDMDGAFSHTLRGGATDLPPLLDALEAHLARAGAPMAAVSAVMIAADEVLTNALTHARADSVSIRAEVRDGRIAVEVEDDGPPFDPTAAAPPRTDLALDEREAGGLGIHLVRQLMDHVRYERTAGRNKLSFSRSYDLMSPSRQDGGGAS